VALLDALLALGMGSKRACTAAVAAELVGLQGDRPRPSIEHPGLIVCSWERKSTRQGARAGTLEGKAATLREKQRCCWTLKERAWRKAMAYAFMLTIDSRRPREVLRSLIVQTAAAVGEGDFASTVMLRMLAERTLPEFLTNLAST